MMASASPELRPGILVEVLDSIAHATSSRAAPEAAPPIDPFDFIGGDELTLSRLLCWCLDSEASHAEGSAFLAAFLDVFGIASDSALRAVRAMCETPAGNRRRIDVLIECVDFILAIENKPYTGFSASQLPDYFTHLETMGKPFALVAIRGWSGCVPADQNIKQTGDRAQFIDADYETVADWLERCIGLSRSDDTRRFLEQMRHHIGRHVLNTGDIDLRNSITRLLSDDPQRMEAALSLIDAAHGIETHLHRRLVSAVAGTADRRWSVSGEPGKRIGNVATGYHYLTIDLDPGWPVVFVFEIAPRATSAIAGVARRMGASLTESRADKIWKALDDRIVRLAKGGDSYWLWWEHVAAFNGTGRLRRAGPNVWKAMIEPGPLAADIVALAGEVDSVIGSILARTP